jgi:CHAT domain-containing protein
VTFLPLAVAPDAPREHAVLDILDVRNASFRGTRLVVLSGCGSGAPWVGTVMAPGLGDAFLDAGAAAVLQTRWEIEDAFARDLVTEFTRRFAEGQDPVTALNAVKREARHRGMAPFHWASYSIVLGGPG